MSTKRHSFRPLLFAVPAPSAPAERPVTGVRKRQDSHLRLSRSPAPATPANVLDELADEQRAFSLELARLGGRIEHVFRKVPHAVAERVCRLAHVRDALASLIAASWGVRQDPRFETNAPLTEYLRGLYAWTNAVVRALGDLVTSSVDGKPDWALFHVRLEEASYFHFDELRPKILRSLSKAAIEDALRNSIGCVFAHADDLEASLDRRPG